ncbi:MAG: Coenzyme F420 hydrogenase/dehydrogenase, beta subunit C-terminal domain [Desulfovibrio sp.]
MPKAADRMPEHDAGQQTRPPHRSLSRRIDGRRNQGKRGLKNAPGRKDLASGNYDRDWLIGPVQRMLLGRAADPVAREAAASGGVLTAALCGLFASGKVDAVLAVGFAPDDPVNPRYLVLASPQAVLAQAGSVYSFIPASDLRRAALEAAKAGYARLAVVCQPCLVPVVRRWQERGEYGVRAVFSFFCGWNMGHEATHYLLRKAGVRPGEVRSLGYRRGPYPGGFGVTARDGREVRFGKESYELVNMQFVRPGCAACTFYMGEGADLVCGDAWIKGQRNLTTVLARTRKGLKLLESVRSRGGVDLFELEERTLLEMHLPNLRYKKYGLSPGMQALTRFFNAGLPKGLAPFRLLSLLSRLRRGLKVGVAVEELQPVEKPLV